jgi:hypothetical protein
MKEITVYFIENKVTNEMYIGSTTNFDNRSRHHVSMLTNNNHSNFYLQEAWNTCGGSNFVFGVLEECSAEDNIEHKREQFWMNKFDCLYNSIPSLTSGIPRTEIRPITSRPRRRVNASESVPYKDIKKDFKPPKHPDTFSGRNWRPHPMTPRPLSDDTYIPKYAITGVGFDTEDNAYYVNMNMANSKSLKFFQRNIESKEAAINLKRLVEIDFGLRSQIFEAI